MQITVDPQICDAHRQNTEKKKGYKAQIQSEKTGFVPLHHFLSCLQDLLPCELGKIEQHVGCERINDAQIQDSKHTGPCKPIENEQ